MQELNKSINDKKIGGIYLFHGDEDFLKNNYKNKIIAALDLENNDINLNYYKDKYNIGEALMLANTMPFGNDKRLIIFENTSIIADDRINEFSNLPSTTVILIIENIIDKRTKGFKFLKEIAKIYEFKKGDERMKIGAINLVLKKYNRKMHPRVMNYIIANSENDMYSIINNMEKLVSATDDYEISEEIAKKIVLPLINNRIFELVRAIVVKDGEKTISLYKDLVYLREAPFKIMSLIFREYKILAQIMDSNMSYKELAKKIGLHEFAAKNYIEVAKKVNKKSIIKGLNYCVDLETDIKSGKIPDRLGLERLIVDLIRE